MLEAEETSNCSMIDKEANAYSDIVRVHPILFCGMQNVEAIDQTLTRLDEDSLNGSDEV